MADGSGDLTAEGAGRAGRWWPTALFTGLTILLTWPNAWYLASRSVEHQDIFFNLWRLRWVHHALTSSPADLFNGNQFHPERGVFAYSDAMLLESLLALPFLALGVTPMLVHNVLLLGAITASGVGAFVLARSLWGSTAGAIVAGLVFAYAPYRFAHYMHMELQWSVWIPWALWAMHRTFDSGRLRDGLLTGVFVALQFVSSIYYGLFLCVLMIPIGGVLLFGTARKGPVLRAFAIGAALVATVALAYSTPYRRASDRVGLRSLEEIAKYSARPSSYLRVPAANRMYGAWRAGSAEVSLYPGVVPVILALAGLCALRPTRSALAYGVALLVAFDLSLGLNGAVYPLLQQHVAPFKGLRAPARASLFVLLALGLLAARAWAAFVSRRRRGRGWAFTMAAASLILVEYWSVPLRLIPYPARAPLYEYLATLPFGVVAEFPVPELTRLPFHDGRYLYSSTYHWKPLVNGYSGYYPQSYLTRMRHLGTFPSEAGTLQLRADNVRYVIVHDGWYADSEARVRTVAGLFGMGAKPLATMDDGWWPATLFELPPP